MTSYTVASVPTQITVPLVVAVYTSGGSDYNPRRFIVATSPDDERVGALEFAWQWADNPPAAVKFRVFTPYLLMRVPAAGTYTLGLYDSPDATETDHVFPLPVLTRNPLMADGS